MSRASTLSVLSVILIGFLLFLQGCNFPDSSPTPENPPPTPISSPTIEVAPVKPGGSSITPDVPQMGQPTLRATLKAGLPPQQKGAQSVKIFLIALEDKGQSGKKIGCDDSVVSVEVQLDKPTQAVLHAALEALLSVNTQYYGGSGLYNSLYQSRLLIDKLVLENGEAVIRLKGELKLGGVCDNPRLQAQLEETAKQFSTVDKVKIFINDVPLDKVLSGQG